MSLFVLPWYPLYRLLPFGSKRLLWEIWTLLHETWCKVPCNIYFLHWSCWIYLLYETVLCSFQAVLPGNKVYLYICMVLSSSCDCILVALEMHFAILLRQIWYLRENINICNTGKPCSQSEINYLWRFDQVKALIPSILPWWNISLINTSTSSALHEAFLT